MLCQRLGMCTQGIGQCRRPINQHAAAIACHAAAGGQQIKQRLAQVPWKIFYWHVLGLPSGAQSGCFKLFQAFQTGRVGM